MASPLEDRLLAQIAQCSNAEARAIAQASLGIYLARTGRFDDAEGIRAELRSVYGDGRSLRVSVRVMCLEALILYFRDLSLVSRDRVMRADVLATASRDSSLIALTSSWLAHIDFNQNNFDSMARALRQCTEAGGCGDDETDCRVSLVLADALAHAGDLSHARLWYERARQTATRVGDHAYVGALTYNRAAMRVAVLRLQAIRSAVSPDDLVFAASKVSSAINYQKIACLRSLDHLLQTAKLGVHALRCEFSDVARIGVALLESGEVPAGSAQEFLLMADVAVALSQLGRLGDSSNWIESVPVTSLAALGADDQALILSRLALAADAMGDTKLSIDLETRALALLDQHAKAMSELRAILERLTAEWPAPRQSA